MSARFSVNVEARAKLACALFHRAWHQRWPGGMHCYDCRCAKCGRTWNEFE